MKSFVVFSSFSAISRPTLTVELKSFSPFFLMFSLPQSVLMKSHVDSEATLSPSLAPATVGLGRLAQPLRFLEVSYFYVGRHF